MWRAATSSRTWWRKYRPIRLETRCSRRSASTLLYGCCRPGKSLQKDQPRQEQATVNRSPLLLCCKTSKWRVAQAWHQVKNQKLANKLQQNSRSRSRVQVMLTRSNYRSLRRRLRWVMKSYKLRTIAALMSKSHPTHLRREFRKVGRIHQQ